MQRGIFLAGLPGIGTRLARERNRVASHFSSYLRATHCYTWRVGSLLWRMGRYIVLNTRPCTRLVCKTGRSTRLSPGTCTLTPAWIAIPADVDARGEVWRSGRKEERYHGDPLPAVRRSRGGTRDLRQVPDGPPSRLEARTLGVLIFHAQHLTPEEQVAWSRAFGPLAMTRGTETRLPHCPEIFVVDNAVDPPVTFSPNMEHDELE